MAAQAISMTCMCRAAPVQFEGELADGRFFYVRSRHEDWEFGVARSVDEAVDVSSGPPGDDPLAFCRQAHHGSRRSDASYLDHREAREIIARCLAECPARPA